MFISHISALYGGELHGYKDVKNYIYKSNERKPLILCTFNLNSLSQVSRFRVISTLESFAIINFLRRATKEMKKKFCSSNTKITVILSNPFYKI